MSESKVVEIEIAEILIDREKSWMVHNPQGIDTWIPKSLAEWYPEDGIMVMPEWMAIEKEFV